VSPSRRATLLLAGCLVLGIGVGMLLVADLGSDGFSTLVNGLAITTGWPFFVCNAIVSGGFLALAALRRVIPGFGTLVQIIVVGATVSTVIELFSTPAGLLPRVGLVLLAMPVLAIGIAAYLGANLGAGPIEAAGLAWDPPFPFRWSYSVVQLLGALVGWLLGATVGLATIVVIALLGPLVDLASRLLQLDLHQGPAHRQPVA
jgi:uncharacterized protein